MVGSVNASGGFGRSVPDCIVLIGEFWQIVEEARSDAGTTDERFDADAVAMSMTERLTRLTRAGILDFSEVYDEVSGRLNTWEMWAACLLISGYLSDDWLSDFRAGIVAL